MFGDNGRQHPDTLAFAVGEDHHRAAHAAPGKLGIQALVAFDESIPGADGQPHGLLALGIRFIAATARAAQAAFRHAAVTGLGWRPSVGGTIRRRGMSPGCFLTHHLLLLTRPRGHRVGDAHEPVQPKE